MIGAFESIVFDCPDPRVLARFYSELLGAEIVGYDSDWAEIVPSGGRPILAFQCVDDFNAPPAGPSPSSRPHTRPACHE